ncbi:MAG: hypothetical protein ACQGVK_18340 [Myxococcota bacterium]
MSSTGNRPPRAVRHREPPAAPRSRGPLRGLALAGVLAALALPGPVHGAESGDPSEPGAYCGLPEPGEVPTCLQPAQARYSDLFVALDEGGDLEKAADSVESDLARTGEDAYLALSSLAYAYWRLASTAARTEVVDPEVAARLEEWNDLLSHVYHKSEDDLEFRHAVRDAARDLEARTSTQGFRPAEGLIDRLDRAQEQLGVRGAVKRVLNRVFEPGHPHAPAAGADAAPSPEPGDE